MMRAFQTLGLINKQHHCEDVYVFVSSTCCVNMGVNCVITLIAEYQSPPCTVAALCVEPLVQICSLTAMHSRFRR